MIKKMIAVFSLTILLGIVTSCDRKHPGYDKTDTGLYYKIHTNVKDNKPKPGQIMQVHMKYSTKDTVIFDNRWATLMPVDIMLIEPDYPGDINEGLGMLSIGDSASFIVDAEPFFTITVRSPVPPIVDPEDYIYFEVVLVNFMDEAEYFGRQY